MTANQDVRFGFVEQLERWSGVEDPYTDTLINIACSVFLRRVHKRSAAPASRPPVRYTLYSETVELLNKIKNKKINKTGRTDVRTEPLFTRK